MSNAASVAPQLVIENRMSASIQILQTSTCTTVVRAFFLVLPHFPHGQTAHDSR